MWIASGVALAMTVKGAWLDSGVALVMMVIGAWNRPASSLRENPQEFS